MLVGLREDGELFAEFWGPMGMARGNLNTNNGAVSPSRAMSKLGKNCVIKQSRGVGLIYATSTNHIHFALITGLIHLTDRGFELQIVPPDMMSIALKRGDHHD